jgi:hypothetical protein
MKKCIIILNLSSLLLTSCGTYQNTQVIRTPAEEAKGCSEIVKSFFPVKRLTPEESTQILKNKIQLDLTPEEARDFFKYFSLGDLDVDSQDQLRSIYLYSATDPKVRIELLNEMNMLRAGHAPNEKNKIWKQFTAHKEKVDAKKKKIINSKEAGFYEKSLLYEKLYYSCKTQVKSAPTAADFRTAKKLTYALTAGALGSSIATYSAVHWEEEKNSKWFNELYFSLGITFALSFFGGKFILANPNLKAWTVKMPVSYLNNAVTDGLVSGVAYGYLFKTDDKELDKKIKELQDDPKAQEKLEELIKIAQEKGLFEKHLKASQSFLKDKTTNQSVDLKTFGKEVTFDDIDMEASRDLLIEALAEKAYAEKAGPLSVGSEGKDRYAFHRIYNLLSAPTNIGMTIMMYNQMCMATDPKKGFIKAVGLYLGASIIMDAVYFEGKKDLINQ